MKKSVITHFTCAAAAASLAFWAGAWWKGRPGSAAAPANTGLVSGLPDKAADIAREKRPGTVVKPGSGEDTVRGFSLRFQLDGGQPLPAERMKEAVAEALTESNPIKRQLLFAKVMESVTPENAAAALKMIRETVGGFEAMRYTGMLAYAWGAVDPLAVMKEFSHDNGPNARWNQSSAIEAWAIKDSAAAMAWLEKQDQDSRMWLAPSLLSGLAQTDPAAALKYAQNLKTPDARRNAGEALAREMVKGGVDKAAAWVDGLTDPDLKNGAFSTVAEQYVRSDLEGAMTFVKKYQSEGYATETIGRVAESVGRRDVTKGLEFASQLSGPAQGKAYGEVIGEWMERDGGKGTLEASAYVTNLPAGVDRDHSAWAISNRMVEDDPASAIAWAGSIKDPGIREAALMDVARQYQHTQPEAYAQWLPQSGLSAEAKERLGAFN
ncbi:MAG TPA: hypothetical protein VHM91_10430, partial [Verrucomicrobiales bacterium]|nr:hypothetical protein [Verrucomicrobiales bacterium]